MRFDDDEAVIRSLYPEGRNSMRAVMRSSERTFSNFCQWCGAVRESVAFRGGLVCIQCDKPEPTVPAGMP